MSSLLDQGCTLGPTQQRWWNWMELGRHSREEVRDQFPNDPCQNDQKQLFSAAHKP